MNHSDHASILHGISWLALVVGIVGLLGRLYVVFAHWELHRDPKLRRNAIYTFILNTIMIMVGVAGLKGWISF